MRRDELGDLTAFLAVAEERSFTRAAARLGTSQSALSHIVRRLEAGLGLRLLTRTTRSVAPTEAGERLIETLRPAFDEIDAKLAALSELREKPAGMIRITTSQHEPRQSSGLPWRSYCRIIRT
jgi:DNA-binding transcriptional LysR family regulator